MRPYLLIAIAIRQLGYLQPSSLPLPLEIRGVVWLLLPTHRSFRPGTHQRVSKEVWSHVLSIHVTGHTVDKVEGGGLGDQVRQSESHIPACVVLSFWV
jgi:hypothetical protein